MTNTCKFCNGTGHTFQRNNESLPMDEYLEFILTGGELNRDMSDEMRFKNAKEYTKHECGCKTHTVNETDLLFHIDNGCQFLSSTLNPVLGLDNPEKDMEMAEEIKAYIRGHVYQCDDWRAYYDYWKILQTDELDFIDQLCEKYLTAINFVEERTEGNDKAYNAVNELLKYTPDDWEAVMISEGVKVFPAD